MILIIDHANTDTRTPTKAHIIMFFARFIFSSSPPERRYIIHPIITAITAITEIYSISVLIKFPIIPYTEASIAASSHSQQPGRAPQLIFGAAA